MPVFGIPGGPGHGDGGRGADRGTPITVPGSPSDQAAHVQAPLTHSPADGPGGGHGAWGNSGYGHDQGNGPGDPSYGNSHFSPPGHVSEPPAVQPTVPTPTPSTASTHGNQGNGDFPTQGPGDAHGVGHADSNAGGPAASHQGHGNGTGACDGLCHGGQNPSLSPATTVAAPSVSVTATPVPVTVTPAPSTPPATTPTPPSTSTTLPVIPSLPSIPMTPKTVGLPSFSSTSSTTPVGFAGASGTGIGGRAVSSLSHVLAGSSVLSLPGAFVRAGAGGRVVPLASTGFAFTPSVAASSTLTGASAGARAGGHHSGGAHGGGTTILLIPRFINHIPAGVWIALAAALALAALGTGAAVLSRRRAHAQAGELAAVAAAALTDPLTGVLNRRGFIEAVERELARARRYQHPFVLAYVDVRGLKSVNDTEGHLAGDALLKSVASLLTECARADDVVGRLGGDELGLLLVEQTPEAAKAVTRRIETQVAARRTAMNLGAPWDLTIGTAAFPQDGQTVDELLATADRRLYQQRGIHLVSSSR